MNTPRNDKFWGDLLSHWTIRPEGTVCIDARRKHTEFAGSDAIPVVQMVRGVNAAVVGDAPIFGMTMGGVSVVFEGLYFVKYHGGRVI